MSEPATDRAATATVRTRRGPSLVWIVPIVALLIGAWLGIKAIREQGPTITITFASAEGLEAGKTRIRYRDVEVGQVEAIGIANDRVQVTARMLKAKRLGERVKPETKTLPYTLVRRESDAAPPLATSSIWMPQGWASATRVRPKRSVRVAGTPIPLSRFTQKSPEPGGIDSRMVRDWLVPRRPKMPGFLKGKVVRIVEASPPCEP